MMAKPMKTLELHYPMIQFLIKALIPCCTNMVIMGGVFIDLFFIFLYFGGVLKINE